MVEIVRSPCPAILRDHGRSYGWGKTEGRVADDDTEGLRDFAVQPVAARPLASSGERSCAGACVVEAESARVVVADEPALRRPDQDTRLQGVRQSPKGVRQVTRAAPVR